MQIKEIIDKQIWETFLLQCREKTFFQSWNWGDFRKAGGEKIWRFGVYDGEQLIAVALTSKKIARRGTYLEVSHGPAFAKATAGRRLAEAIYDHAKAGKPVLKKQILQTILEKLKAIASEEQASFIRMNPLWERNEENNTIFRDLGFRQAPMYASYESSWKLDITPDEAELMKNMRKTTRYLIRQAAKNQGIEIRQSTSVQDVETFYSLSRAVGKRQRFVPYSKEYLREETAAFLEDNGFSFFFGSYGGEIIAACLVIFWSGVGFYHQAASKGEYAKLSIPYALQWEAIREAKARGCKLYDFWGYVDPKKYPNHPWAGPTLFKMGFGGKPYEYVKTQDYPLSWKYWPTAIFEMVRAKRRGF